MANKGFLQSIFNVLLSTVLLSFSCRESHKETPVEKVLPTRISYRLDRKAIPETLLTLNTQPGSVRVPGKLEENLFGKFFCDRAEFYIINHPQNNLYASSVESITLCYLDGELRQARYALSGNVVNRLIRDFGNFSIMGLDIRNREVIAAGKILRRTDGQLVLNPKLDRYEMRWRFGDKEVRYRVRPDSNFPFVYMERVLGYERELKAIESDCI